MFLSASDSSVYWYGDAEINFFLFEIHSLPHVQSSYMNNYTIFNTSTAQQSYCSSRVSLDYWAVSTEYCGSGYTYQFALSPISSSSLDCYIIMQNYTLAAVETRYVDHQLFDNCGKIGTQAFSSVILQYWQWAQASYLLDQGFDSIILDMNSGFGVTLTSIDEKIAKINTYYDALQQAYSKLVELRSRVDLYQTTMNCSVVNELTSQIYVGFCGAILEYLFDLSLYIGALGVCNLFFSLSIVLFLFRYRTDLEIEQERMLRKIGRETSADVLEKTGDITQRGEETGINKE